MKALEFIISAEFGMFRKPDRQDPALTFNFIPKSAVLGICGAILGLDGYKNGKSPEFLTKLNKFNIAVTPLYFKKTGFELAKKPFSKTFVTFNNFHGYGNFDGNGIYTEQILIKPAYLITVISDEKDQYFQELEKKLHSGITSFRPYLGKNEFISNLEFKGAYTVSDNSNELVQCESIYAPSHNYKPNPRGSDATPLTFLIMDEYSYALDEHGRHCIRHFCYRDGELHNQEVDNAIGKLYLLKGEKSKTVFAF